MRRSRTGCALSAHTAAVGSFPCNTFRAAAPVFRVGIVLSPVAQRMQANPVDARDPANRWATLAPRCAYAGCFFCCFIPRVAVLTFDAY